MGKTQFDRKTQFTAETSDRCRLYLQVPAPLTAKRLRQLDRALVAVRPPCVLLTLNGDAFAKVPAGPEIDAAIDRVQSAGSALLMEDPQAAADLGADGVHIPADPRLYANARQLLGPSANIGVACGRARHEAMELAEAGADYVAFGNGGTAKDERSPAEEPAMAETLELISWWSQIFVVPCVAFDVDRIVDAERLAQAGADFIAPSAEIFEDESPVDRLIDMDRAIAGGRRAA